VGVIGNVNLLPGRAMGRYAQDVTDEELRAAEVILVDVHWYTALATVKGLVSGIRARNPHATVIVGGITAAFYPAQVLELAEADYLLTGDTERCLPPLVAALLEGREVPRLPGVWSRGQAAPPSPGARLSEEEFSRLDWLSIDWFPGLEQRAVETHRAYREGHNRCDANSWYPMLPVTRGCVRGCRFCAGSYQRSVFGDGVLRRTPESLRCDLERVAADPRWAFVAIWFGDTEYLDYYAPALQGARLPLDAYLTFCSTPRPESLRAIRSAFTGAVDYSVFAPVDLPHRAGEPDPRSGTAAFDAAMAEALRKPRTTACVWHFARSRERDLPQMSGAGSLELRCACDWDVRLPDDASISSRNSRAEQFHRVFEAARGVLLGILAGGLCPALGVLPAERPLSPDELSLVPPFRRAVLERVYRRVREEHLLGLDELLLEWGCTADHLPGGSGWARPTGRLPGSCRPFAGMQGPGWRGQAKVPEDVALALMPLPVLVLRDGGTAVSPADWEQALFPALEVPRGPGRLVQAGGHCTSDSVVMWLQDGEARTVRRLRLPGPPTVGG
jgi:hypothetical protein